MRHSEPLNFWTFLWLSSPYGTYCTSRCSTWCNFLTHPSSAPARGGHPLPGLSVSSNVGIRASSRDTLTSTTGEPRIDPPDLSQSAYCSMTTLFTDSMFDQVFTWFGLFVFVCLPFTQCDLEWAQVPKDWPKDLSKQYCSYIIVGGYIKSVSWQRLV